MSISQKEPTTRRRHRAMEIGRGRLFHQVGVIVMSPEIEDVKRVLADMLQRWL